MDVSGLPIGDILPVETKILKSGDRSHSAFDLAIEWVARP